MLLAAWLQKLNKPGRHDIVIGIILLAAGGAGAALGLGVALIGLKMLLSELQ